jgi:hypothetical protein
MGRLSSRSATDIVAIPQVAGPSRPPATTVSSTQKGTLWQEPTPKDPESGSQSPEHLSTSTQLVTGQPLGPERANNIAVVELLPWIWPNHVIWIFITVASTFVLISIIPIMLIDVITSPAVALPSTEVSPTAPIITRSYQLDTPSWNYDNLCSPRKGQCQLGTYTTRNVKTMDIVWFDEDCKKVDYVAACQDLACKDPMVVLTGINDSESEYPDPVIVQFQDPENYLDVPSIMYGGAAYSQDKNEVGSWFGPDSDLEFFSLLWFDC